MKYIEHKTPVETFAQYYESVGFTSLTTKQHFKLWVLAGRNHNTTDSKLHEQIMDARAQVQGYRNSLKSDDADNLAQAFQVDRAARNYGITDPVKKYYPRWKYTCNFANGVRHNRVCPYKEMRERYNKFLNRNISASREKGRIPKICKNHLLKIDILKCP